MVLLTKVDITMTMTDTPQTMKSTRSPRESGFSLIELLVVIAIIAILASISLPVLSSAKESARTVKCRNNLYQMAVASMAYSTDHNGNLPSFKNWLYTRMGAIETGSLYRYAPNKQIYLCPTEKTTMSESGKSQQTSSSNFGAMFGKTHKRDYSYAMNCGICHNTKISNFISPSKTMLYMEAELAPTDYSGQVGPAFGGFTRHLLSQRHQDAGHIIMSDLHAEKLGLEKFSKVSKKKIFWFPTKDTTGGNGMNLGIGLK